MDWLKYLIIFVGSFIFIYVAYFLFVANPLVRTVRGKSKKKKDKKYPSEVYIFTGYYKIDIDKVGIIKMIRTLNLVNAFILAILVTIVFPVKTPSLRVLLLAILILPTIWFSYYLLAKYFKYVERKSENV